MIKKGTMITKMQHKTLWCITLLCFASFASDYNYKRAIFLDGPKKDFGKYSESVVPASALLHRSCVTSLACGYKKNFICSLFYG